MDWRILFSIFVFAVVLDTWTPWAPKPYFGAKIAIRVGIVIIGLYWILVGLGLNVR